MAGLDEVGRGAWAGPLTVGVAVVRPGVTRRSMPAVAPGLQDAERGKARGDLRGCRRVVPSLGRRARLPRRVRRVGDDRGVPGGRSPGAGRLGQAPEALLVDGPVDLLRHPDDPFAGAVRPIVDGDAKCASVAAASVLAKVVRDRMMRQEADHFPAYAFERNKGYPSPVHQTALRGYGPSAIHRRSWAFVRELPWCGQHPGDGAQTTAVTSAKWQATGWPWPRSTRAGSSVAQIS